MSSTRIVQTTNRGRDREKTQTGIETGIRAADTTTNLERRDREKTQTGIETTTTWSKSDPAATSRQGENPDRD